MQQEVVKEIPLAKFKFGVSLKYTYDSWGKVISTTGTKADTVGKLNPYRYRGYRYDEETGFYYLQSRYYNPEWGRFINPDSLTTTGHDLLGHNMFAYCLNNPVNMSDDSGEFANFIVGAVIGGLTQYVTDVATNFISDGKISIDGLIPKSSLAVYMGAMASGAISGGLAGAINKVVTKTLVKNICTIVGEGFANGVGSIIQQNVEAALGKDKISTNWIQVRNDVVSGYFTMGASKAIGSFAPKKLTPTRQVMRQTARKTGKSVAYQKKAISVYNKAMATVFEAVGATSANTGRNLLSGSILQY